ncbi:Calponin-2 [Plecturocebus cupreus]
MTAPGTWRHIYDNKLGTDKCDNSMSLQMGYTQGANESSQVFGLGQQIYDPNPDQPYCSSPPTTCPVKYCTGTFTWGICTMKYCETLTMDQTQ